MGGRAGWLEEGSALALRRAAHRWRAAGMLSRFSEFAGEDPVSLLLDLQHRAGSLVREHEEVVNLVAGRCSVESGSLMRTLRRCFGAAAPGRIARDVALAQFQRVAVSQGSHIIGKRSRSRNPGDAPVGSRSSSSTPSCLRNLFASSRSSGESVGT